MKINLQNFILMLSMLISFEIFANAQTFMPISEKEKKIITNLEKDKLLPIKPNEVVVIGEVGKPQIIAKKKSLTIVQAISMAGGVLKTADVNIIVVQKNPDYGYLFTIFVNLNLIKSGKQNDLNLEDGDIVVVMKETESLPTIFPFKETPLPVKIKIPDRYV